MKISAKAAPILIDYIREEAALFVVVMDQTARVIEANNYVLRLVGEDAPGRLFSSMVIDFKHIFQLEQLILRPDEAHLLNIESKKGLPQTYYFYFHLIEDGRILAIGQQDPQEIENMRYSLLDLNTELNNLTRKLHKKNAALQKLDIQKNQFFGMAAHDIRHPLSVIKMYSEFLKLETSGQLSRQHSEFLNYIGESAQAMENILNDFLDFSVFETGRLDLRYEDIDVTAWVTRIVQSTLLLARRNGIEVVLQDASQNSMICVDESKMTQVMNNLLSNALKFSRPGDLVTVSVKEGEDGLVLSVRDQGPGISEIDSNRIFTPFLRLDSPVHSSEKSSGLGLAIVKKIVDAHQGRIWLDSKPGTGSTFFVFVPRKMVETSSTGNNN